MAAERVVDVAAGSVGGRSTIDLIVSQRCQSNTLGQTESYVEVHQSTAAQQISTLCTIHAKQAHPSISLFASKYTYLNIIYVSGRSCQKNTEFN